MSPSNTHIHTYLRHACIHIHLSVCTRPLTLGVPHVGTHRNTYIITYRTTHGNTNTQTALNRPLTCEKLCFFKKKKRRGKQVAVRVGGGSANIIKSVYTIRIYCTHTSYTVHIEYVEYFFKRGYTSAHIQSTHQIQ